MTLLSDRTPVCTCTAQHLPHDASNIVLALSNAVAAGAPQIQHDEDDDAFVGSRDRAVVERQGHALAVCNHLAAAIRGWQAQAQALLEQVEDLQRPVDPSPAPPAMPDSMEHVPTPFWDEVNTTFNYREASYDECVQYVATLEKEAAASAEHQPHTAHSLYEEAAQLLNWWATKRSMGMEPDERKQLRVRAQSFASKTVALATKIGFSPEPMC